MALSKLECKVLDALECSVCLEELTDHRCLECGHTYCLKCLENLVKNKEITCPDCRYLQKTNCRNLKRVQHMTKVVAINKIQEALTYHKAVNSGKIVCAVCMKPSESCAVFCDVCCQMCRPCFNKHLEQVGFNDHEIVPLRRKSFCPDHLDKSLEYHCVSCQKFICNICVVSSHTSHKVEVLSKALVDVINQLNKVIKNLYYFRKDNVRDFKLKVHEEYKQFLEMWNEIQAKGKGLTTSDATTAKTAISDLMKKTIFHLLDIERLIDAVEEVRYKANLFVQTGDEDLIFLNVDTEPDCDRLVRAKKWITVVQDTLEMLSHKREITRPVFPKQSTLDTDEQIESFTKALTNWKEATEVIQIHIKRESQSISSDPQPDDNPDFCFTLVSSLKMVPPGIWLSINPEKEQFTVFHDTIKDVYGPLHFVVYDYEGRRIGRYGENLGLIEHPVMTQISIPPVCTDTNRNFIVYPIIDLETEVVFYLMRINQETMDPLNLEKYCVQITAMAYCSHNDSYFMADKVIKEVDAKNGRLINIIDFEVSEHNITFGEFGKERTPVFIAPEYKREEGKMSTCFLTICDLKGQRLWTKETDSLKQPHVHNVTFGPNGYILMYGSSNHFLSHLKFDDIPEADPENRIEYEEHLYTLPGIEEFSKTREVLNKSNSFLDMQFDEKAGLLFVTISDMNCSPNKDGESLFNPFPRVFIYRVTRNN